MWRRLRVAPARAYAAVALFLGALLVVPANARPFTAELSDVIRQHLYEQQLEAQESYMYARHRALSAAEMEELIAAKPEARVAPMDPTGTILLEAENGIEEAAWRMHTVAEHSPECVAAVIPVCRKHRDWCRQECDHFDADSEDRCHSEKCDELLRSCHRAHFDRCETGKERGVHVVWSQPMDSARHCHQVIRSQCLEEKEICYQHCEQPQFECGPHQCDSVEAACRHAHRFSCSDSRNSPLPSARSRRAEGSEAGEGSGGSESAGSAVSSSVGDAQEAASADSAGAAMEAAVDGYIQCEEAVRKKCDADVAHCLKLCLLKNTDKETPLEKKCNPDRCYELQQSCPERMDEKCGPHPKKNNQTNVTPHLLKADEHFCRVEDTECNFFVPDTVDLVHCTAANDYCKAAEEAKSHVSSCPKCELKRLKCHENCKRQVIIFSSRFGPTTTSTCADEKCFEEAELCHHAECKSVKASHVAAGEQSEGTARRELEIQQRLREQLETRAADEEAHKLMIAYGLSTVLPSRCGNDHVDHGEDCDGGNGCNDRCACGQGTQPHSPPLKGCKPGHPSGGPAPCSFTQSGCMYGKGQVTPKIVPQGTLVGGVPL